MLIQKDNDISSGWWFEPLWKIWKSIGMIRNPIYGKIKLMFQTTNQCFMKKNGKNGDVSREIGGCDQKITGENEGQPGQEDLTQMMTMEIHTI